MDIKIQLKTRKTNIKSESVINIDTDLTKAKIYAEDRCVYSTEGSKIFRRVLDRVPVETSLRTSMMMDDYEHWKDGEYLGDIELLERRVQSALKIINSLCDKTSIKKEFSLQHED